ncbi:MAG: SHOCT domain-containing protein [Pseudonocardiaceae bacterium]
MTLWNILVSIFWFMVLFAWIWLLIMILSDIFRDRELPGWGKALWTLFLIVLPWLGALVYLIARGGSMQERAAAQTARSDEAFRQYVKETAAEGKPSTADELVKLAGLRDRGAISAEDYDRAKTMVLKDERVPAMDGHQLRASSAT